MLQLPPDPIRRVLLDLPCEPLSLRLLRLAISDLMSISGFSVVQIERGALVVDELVSALLGASSVGRLRVEVDHGPQMLDARGRLSSGATVEVPELDPVAREIIDAGVGRRGRWHLSLDQRDPCFRVVLGSEAAERALGERRAIG